MAIAIVNRKQTGSGAVATLAITSATAGNLLVAFIQKATSTAEVKGKDNISGETGWTVNATSAVFNGSADSLWVATKVAVGGETELNPAANGGTINGISYFELSGTEGAVDAITHADNTATATTATSTAITTSDAGSWLFAGVAMRGGGTGTITAWTGGPPTLTNTETVSTRLLGGAGNPEGTVSAKTFTANWTTTHVTGMLVIALKPSGVETKTVTANVKGAGALTASTQKVAPVTINVKGAGKATASALKVAQPTANVKGAGLASATTLRVGIVTGNVKGAGLLKVTLAGIETKIVSGTVKGGGGVTSTTSGVRLASGLVHGAGAVTSKTSGIRLAGGLVHGGGQISVSAAKIGLGVGRVSGAGRIVVSALRVGTATALVTGGGRLGATVSSTRSPTALVHGGGQVTVTLPPAAVSVLGRVYGGGRITVVLNIFVPTTQFPAAQPLYGHVSVGERGRIDRNMGRFSKTQAGGRE